jgi:hypothetical protein
MTFEELTVYAVFQNEVVNELAAQIDLKVKELFTTELGLPIPITIVLDKNCAFAIKYLDKTFYVEATMNKLSDYMAKRSFCVCFRFIQYKYLINHNLEKVSIVESVARPIFMDHLGNLASDENFKETIVNDFTNEIKLRILEIVVKHYIK